MASAIDAAGAQLDTERTQAWTDEQIERAVVAMVAHLNRDGVPVSRVLKKMRLSRATLYRRIAEMPESFRGATNAARPAQAEPVG